MLFILIMKNVHGGEPDKTLREPIIRDRLYATNDYRAEPLELRVDVWAADGQITVIDQIVIPSPPISPHERNHGAFTAKSKANEESASSAADLCPHCVCT